MFDMLNLARIKKDKFYSVLYDQYGEEFIKEAGYFENSCKEDIEIDDTLDIMCTPINFLKNNVIDENKQLYNQHRIVVRLQMALLNLNNMIRGEQPAILDLFKSHAQGLPVAQHFLCCRVGKRLR